MTQTPHLSEAQARRVLQRLLVAYHAPRDGMGVSQAAVADFHAVLAALIPVRCQSALRITSADERQDPHDAGRTSVCAVRFYAHLIQTRDLLDLLDGGRPSPSNEGAGTADAASPSPVVARNRVSDSLRVVLPR
jgi:hypothetical protein